MNLNLRLILFCSAFLIFQQLLAQKGGNSPYSVAGVGDLSAPGYIRNAGMGGTGISNGHPEFINIQNPALLPVNIYSNLDSTTKFTMLEAGLQGQLRRLDTKSTVAYTNGFNIQYFSFLFPISRRWSTSFGLRPFSSVQNRYISYISQDKLVNTNVSNAVNDYKINGSLNQVHLANGYDLSKKFSVGLLAAYIFGNITEQSVTQAQLSLDGSLSSNTGTYLQTYYSGFQLKPGISYRTELKDSSSRGSGVYLNMGLTFDYFPGFSANQSRKLVGQDPYQGLTTLSDTIHSYRKTKLPPMAGFGISFDRPNHWTLAMDFTYAGWSYFQSFPNSYSNVTMNDSYTIAVGGEIKPGDRVTLKSKEYRIGFAYTKSPITINNRQLDDISVSLGTSIPLGRKDGRFKAKPLTKINAALVVGRRGTTDANMIREQYYRISFGVLIHDKWFHRWRID